MSRIAAVLACRRGWYVLRETPLPGPWNWFVAAGFEETMRRLDGYDVVALDIPLSAYEFVDRDTDEADAGIHERYRHADQRVREVHDYVRENPGAAELLYEVHPNLSFLELDGGFEGSRARAGKLRLRDRLSSLCDIFPSGTLYEALTAYPRKEVGKIDILDAFAMLWSAKRIATSRAERLPSTPVYDARGFDMAIWY